MAEQVAEENYRENQTLYSCIAWTKQIRRAIGACGYRIEILMDNSALQRPLWADRASIGVE